MDLKTAVCEMPLENGCGGKESLQHMIHSYADNEWNKTIQGAVEKDPVSIMRLLLKSNPIFPFKEFFFFFAFCLSSQFPLLLSMFSCLFVVRFFPPVERTGKKQ